MATTLTKTGQIFFRDALNSGAPKPFITSLIWMARKMKIEPKWVEVEELSHELDNHLLEGKNPDRRSAKND